MKFSHDHFVATTKHMARQLNRIRNIITNSIDFQFVARINKNISYPPSFITILILTLHLQNLFHFHLSIVLESIPSNNPPLLLGPNSRAPFKRRPSSKFERSLLKEAPRVSFPAGQLPDDELPRFGHASPQGRCPTRGSSEIQISHARHFSPSLSLSQRSRGRCEDNRRTGLFHGREFYLALPPFNLINRGGS